MSVRRAECPFRQLSESAKEPGANMNKLTDEAAKLGFHLFNEFVDPNPNNLKICPLCEVHYYIGEIPKCKI